VTEPAQKNAKLPSFQFYPGDWRKDPGVQSLTYQDRGVWFEILCMMHESEQRGRLLLNGSALPDDALARLLGLDRQVLSNTLSTLLARGVASRDPATGALLNRRMVRDEEIRKIRRKCGKLGGNPKLLIQKTTTEVNQTSNQNPEGEDEEEAIPPPIHPKMQSAYEREMGYHQDARSVLFYLREATGCQFAENDDNLAAITLCLRDFQACFVEVKKMIDRQCKLWGSDPEKRQWLRVKTLFAIDKFDSYYAARNQSVDHENNRKHDKANPRNADTYGDTADQGKRIADKLARQAKERAGG
jgi:uncharacterized phage protein (TIGR02220 family)